MTRIDLDCYQRDQPGQDLDDGRQEPGWPELHDECGQVGDDDDDDDNDDDDNNDYGSKKSEAMDDVEKQLKDALQQQVWSVILWSLRVNCHFPDQTESENKYELMAQKLKVKEGEAVRSTEKADGIECKFIEIEDELKVGLI